LEVPKTYISDIVLYKRHDSTIWITRLDGIIRWLTDFQFVIA